MTATTPPLPPIDLNAERCLLGSMMLSGGKAVPKVRCLVGPDSFCGDGHAAIFQACLDLFDEGGSIDLVLLRDALGSGGKLDGIGGPPALADIVESVPDAEHAEHYAGIVARTAALRRVWQAEEKYRRALHAGDAEARGEALDRLIGAERQAGGDNSLLDTVRLADVAAQPLAWLWPGRIPLGKLTLLAGDPSLGKSLLTLEIAARVSRGAPWPDAQDQPNATGKVILLSAEDDVADTIRPRLDAAGADSRRIVAIQGVRGDGEQGPRTFSLAEDLPALEQAVADAGNVRLVIIDPVSAFIGRCDDHRNAELRGLLAPLAALAGKYRLAVLAVSHLNKSGGSRALYRTMGSLAYVAAARAAWLAVKDAENPNRRLLLPTKNNLAAEPTGLAYEVRPSSDDHSVPVVVWDSQPVRITADDALADDAADRQERREIDSAVDWLRQELADGPLPAKDVSAHAKQNGIHARTLQRAKDKSGVRSKRSGFGGAGGWMWELP